MGNKGCDPFPGIPPKLTFWTSIGLWRFPEQFSNTFKSSRTFFLHRNNVAFQLGPALPWRCFCDSRTTVWQFAHIHRGEPIAAACIFDHCTFRRKKIDSHPRSSMSRVSVSLRHENKRHYSKSSVWLQGWQFHNLWSTLERSPLSCHMADFCFNFASWNHILCQFGTSIFVWSWLKLSRHQCQRPSNPWKVWRDDFFSIWFDAIFRAKPPRFRPVLKRICAHTCGSGEIKSCWQSGDDNSVQCRFLEATEHGGQEMLWKIGLPFNFYGFALQSGTAHSRFPISNYFNFFDMFGTLAML